MMRTLAAFLLGVCALVGAAAPAQADQVMEGVFTITPEGGKPGTWTIFPSCVPVVGDLREALYLPVGCRMHVQASAGLVGGDAVLTGGQWA